LPFPLQPGAGSAFKEEYLGRRYVVSTAETSIKAARERSVTQSPNGSRNNAITLCSRR
jgi:hypothetical protein